MHPPISLVYLLSLHAALPISRDARARPLAGAAVARADAVRGHDGVRLRRAVRDRDGGIGVLRHILGAGPAAAGLAAAPLRGGRCGLRRVPRSEEQSSALQSRENL